MASNQKGCLINQILAILDSYFKNYLNCSNSSMVFGIAFALYMVSEGDYYKSGVSFQGWLLLVVEQGFVFIYVGS